MKTDTTSRREFLRQGIAAGVALPAMSAAGYARILGANERLNLGLIGCGGRGKSILRDMLRHANANAVPVAICDIWKQVLETYPVQVEKLFGVKPRAYADYRKLLEDPDIHAVIIATPAHQHCGQVIDAARAKKHVYVEKPIAPLMEDLEPLNRCYDAVKESGIVIQHGTQGSSAVETLALKDFFAGGKLGRIFRVESTINHYEPYWNQYRGPKTEGETDWKAFLYGKPYRPFDADQHASWMGYQDFSSGPIGGWMSHFSNFVHAVTGCGCPVKATAFGGIYAPTSDRRRTAPDNVTVILEYAEGFYTQFVTHFGSALNSETTWFMLDKGLVETRFGHFPGNPVYSSKGVNSSIPEQKLLEKDTAYPGTAHVLNWIQCIREGGETNANMDIGYKQGIAVILGDAAHRLGRKVVFEREKRRIRPA